MGGFPEYDQYDGLGLAELVRNKEVKPVELVEEAIGRIEKLNPRLNAVIFKMYDLAREAAQGDLPDGPFKGVPILLKDLLVAYAGVPMHCGSRFLADFVPDHDCELVRRFKAAGVIVVGKTNTPEYGLLPVTEPELFGPSNNPWDLSRTTGGSSGGSAAAVAAGMVPLAHGNDGGGSIRVPASCCGVFGLKPTRGRNPLGPDFGEAWQGLACDHVLTRSVRDSAAMLDATAGPDVGAPYFTPPPSRPFIDHVNLEPGRLRVAYTIKPFFPGAIHQDCVRGLESAVKLCQELGHEVVEAVPELDGRAFARSFLTLVCGETRAEIEQAEELLGRKASINDFEAATWVVGLLGKEITAAEFSRAVRSLQYMGRKMGHFFESYDLLLTPTLASPPTLTGALQPRGAKALALKVLGSLNAGPLIHSLAGIDALADEVWEFISYTPLSNATGQPAMSVPLYWNGEGLPVGVHFMGRFGDEATLIRLAAQLERALPWFDRRPPISDRV